MNSRGYRVFLMIICLFALTTAASACGEGSAPTDNDEVNQNNQEEDAGNDADDAGDADADDNEDEVQPTGEPCPCGSLEPDGAGLCPSCEEEWCVTPSDHPESDAFCSRRCDGDEDCDDNAEWECIDNSCRYAS